MAVTFHGVSWMPATDNADAAATTATVTPPASMQANDYVVVFSSNTEVVDQTLSIGVTGGQSWTSETQFEAESNALQIYHCRFNGTWDADPRFDWTISAAYAVAMVVFRGVDTTTALDTAIAQAGYVAPSSPFDVTIGASSITTVTDAAMLVAFWLSGDNNTWALQTAGWTNPNSQAQWRNQGTTSEFSISLAYKEQAAAGGNAAVTNRQATLGGDKGLTAILALRPAAGGGAGSTPQGMALLGVGA